MNSDLLITLVLLSCCAVLFAINRPRMDVVALSVLVVLPLTGILTIQETFAGFSDPSVILIAALFVIGEALVRTGVAFRLGELIIDKAGKSETRLLVYLMIAVAGLGSVMSSTGIVAIFIPVALSVARQLEIPASRLMMPLSYAALVSGMLTLVGTPPNLILDSALKRSGHTGIGFFSFTPIGLTVLVAAVCYMLLVRRKLGGAQDVAPPSGKRTMQHLIREYQLAGRGRRLRVSERSALVGQTLRELELRRRFQFNIIALERSIKLRHEVLSPRADLVLQAGDILLIDSTGMERSALPMELGLLELPLSGTYLTDQEREVGMVEVLVPPESTLIGRSVRESGFRSTYGANVVGLRRGGKVVDGNFLEQKLTLGDTLLLIGPWKAIRKVQSQPRDVIVLSLPAESDTAAPALSRAPYALVSLALMAALMVTGAVPNVIAALITWLLLGAFRCIDIDSAYTAIRWQTLLVIVGMMPFALALEKTGGSDLAAESLVHLLDDANPRLLLAALFVVTAAIGLFISNTATAVLMAPIVLSMAERLNVAPHAFAVTVALAASTAFMTPVSSPVNMLVMTPGGYRFLDFLRLGVPFAAFVLAIVVALVPLFFPF